VVYWDNVIRNGWRFYDCDKEYRYEDETSYPEQGRRCCSENDEYRESSSVFFFIVVGDALASMRWIWGREWHFPGNDYVL
jgi:hypothetical protein